MESVLVQYWPQFVAYTGIVVWLMRLESRVSSNHVLMDRIEKTSCNLTDAIGELRETVAELKGIFKAKGK